TPTRTPTGPTPTPTQTFTPTSTPTTIPTGWVTKEYSYSATIPHAVEEVSVQQSAVGTYEYDENGNMTCRTEEGVVYIQEYNTENRISSIIRLADGDCETPGDYTTKWDFMYDGDGVRTTTMTTTYEDGLPAETTWTAYFFGGAYEVRSDNTTIKYYSFGGQTIMNDGSGLKYLLTDHLGSVVAVTDDQGTLTSQQRYLPFGGVRTNIGSIVQTDYGYTGQRNLDEDIGLMDYKFRFYSPYLNHFTQPDSIVPDPYNPQDWNRYSYVRNNPMRYTDPSGHSVDCGIGDSTCDEARREYHYSWRKASNTSFKTYLRAKDAYDTYSRNPENALEA